MSSTTVATAAGGAPAEDMIIEILTRLEDASVLFRCLATCRRWRALSAEPSLIRRLRLKPSFAGFFTNEWRRGEGASFVPCPRSALGVGRRLLSSYIPDAPGLSDWMTPLTSHNGLLLVRLFSRDSRAMRLAVCNPLAGTWDVLPTLTVNETPNIVGHAIVATGADCCSSQQPPSGSFRVLLLVATGVLHAFSSGQPSWSPPTNFPENVQHNLEGATIAHKDAAVCQGAAHWLFVKSTNLHILRVDPRAGYITSTRLLVQRKPHQSTRLTTTTDGTLLSLCKHDGKRQVEIWEEYTSGYGVCWHRTKVIELSLQLEGARCMCLGARSGRLVLMDRHQRVYVLDLKGGAMNKMEDEFSYPNLIAVPMEIDWPLLFMSRRLRIME